MSTRCQIGIYQSKGSKTKDFEVLLYKHCDGYPDGVLPVIQPFLERFSKDRSDDVEYCGAWLMHHLIEESIKGTLKHGYGPKDGKTFTGYGISNEFHGDIEYFYKIYPGAIEVYQCRYDENPDNWKLINTIELKK